jgi:hypothetical protein
MMKAWPMVLLLTWVLCASASIAMAGPTLEAEVSLNAEGGVDFKVPKWRAERTEAGLAVFERAPDKAKAIGFALLVLAIEEGPETTENMDWTRVRDNIVAAAKASGSVLALDVGDAWEGSEGLAGRRMSGTTKVGERTVKVEMIALAAPKVLITVSSVGRSDDSSVAELALAVATTARRPQAP